MLFTKAVRSAWVALAVVLFSLALAVPSAYATLGGKYLVSSASKGTCLRASSISALQVVVAAACDANDPNQRWRVIEVAQNAGGAGINTLSLPDGVGGRLCLTGARYYQSAPYLEQCVEGKPRQQWVTSGAIDYPGVHGDSYRLRWYADNTFCLDNGGAVSSNPYLIGCLPADDPGRSNQQWYFTKL